MSNFIQLHMLTSYPPANLNRDDLGRPKTAVMGGAQRLRISSQSLKRAWRTSSVFEDVLKGSVGTRTKRVGSIAYKIMLEKGVKEKDALKWARQVAGVFGKSVKEGEKRELETEQLAHVSPSEMDAVKALAARVAETGKAPEEDDLKLLRKDHRGADIAMFGRMLADRPAFNTEAAAQVAHAVTVHKVAVEDDFFTAVDDLNEGQEDLGAGHMGQTEFAAGLFYGYICINRDLLLENLSGDDELAAKSLRALTEAALTVAPTGKQTSFASRACASYALAERGARQPRSLSVAFLKPVAGPDMLAGARDAIGETRAKMDKVYGPLSEEDYVMDAVEGKGTLKELLDFVSAG